MKNKKLIIIVITTLILFISSIYISTKSYIKKYDYNNNIIISNLIQNIEDYDGELNKEEIIKLLNKEKLEENEFLSKYGINIKEDFLSNSSKKVINELIITNTIIVIIFIMLIVIINYLYIIKQNKELKKIIEYLEEINRKNYNLDLISNDENDLSLLKNEIYKVVVMLKENAENTLKDKINLKNSLENISHQLKTPLTSISIMLDNIIDNKEMDELTREEFLTSIKREIVSINFLIQEILKLSNFDANIIIFKKEKVKVKDIIDNAVKNISMLCDLKNININVTGDEKTILNCDFKWQVEAITNILKNAVEHSNENGNIDISYKDNKIFTEIIIKDYGCGIKRSDIPKIFERFYKTNYKSDSYGIGLSLAKMIIESDNGVIRVDSKLGEYTEFKIKYMN